MTKLSNWWQRLEQNLKPVGRSFWGEEKGASLIEALVALAILGFIGVAFLGALATSSSTRLIADEHVSARIIAESQIEDIKKQTFAFSYDPSPIPPGYPGYSATVDVESMRNGNIQKITVSVRHRNKTITTLESYKVNR